MDPLDPFKPPGPDQPGQQPQSGQQPQAPQPGPYPGQQPGQPVPGQHPAYHPYQQFPGYPAPPVAPTVNGLSIASLISGIVCCLPPLGLVFGLIGLRQIKRRGQRGRGLAISGIVLSTVSTLLITLFFATGGAGEFWKGFKEGIDEVASYRTVEDLSKGDCYDLPGAGDKDGKEVSEVKIIDCDSPHEAEITGGYTITGYDDYPGEETLAPVAELRCEEIDFAYAMDVWAIPASMEPYYYFPTGESWKQGDRRVSCGYSTSKNEKTTGSLRRDASTLNGDQLAYLKAENGFLRSGFRLPEDEFTAAAHLHRAWAKDTSSALADSAKALRGHAWQGDVRKTALQRADQFDASRAHWDKAAKATSEEVFWDHIYSADEALKADTEVAIRKALKGLETTAPAQEERV
ncbi:DUF4190 domain-containing protein [Streptomyces sp. NPDC048057]|uniref:DUF4190 domain-containing protein n=1 Tax=Streptomyces sp. NPDC048057 TaxID=3155628 RepID=UPI0033FB9345